MPPTPSPGPFFVFFTKYLKGLNPQPTGGIRDMPGVAKAGAALWRSMSDVEKQVST